jgi:3,4-dihydroxy 2-butanone 4-phosphate synthase/GTP cyclohydrolase II
MPISPIPELVAELAAGRMVILVDEEDRENEGDLVLAAEHVTPEAINFMARHARGLICLTLTRERCEHLQLPPMASRNGTKHGTAFTVSIEAATGVTTGISAADRARTVQVAVARDTLASDLVQPGHVFPLQAQDGGVLMRAGHTEAGCDLAGMAGMMPAAVICEVMKDDGTMARLPDLQVFAQEHGLKIGTIADLIGYRSRNETLIERLGARTLHTPQGEFHCTAFHDKSGGLHLALTHGQWTPTDEVPVRVHEPRQRPFVAAAHRLADAEGRPLRRGRAAELHRRQHAADAAAAARAPRRRGAARADGPAHLRRRRADPAPAGRHAHAAAGQPAPHAQHDGLRPRDHRVHHRPRMKWSPQARWRTLPPGSCQGPLRGAGAVRQRPGSAGSVAGSLVRI